MTDPPLVSIITIFHNGERFIGEAIESILRQTYSNWELLLVDDGSSDRATAIVQDFVTRFPARIRYLEHARHANRGMSASRNLGLKHARGEYVSFLDADDVWRPDKLADQVRLLVEHPEAAYVYGPLELWRSWTGRPSDTDELQSLGLAADRMIQPPQLLNLFLRNEKNIPSGILARTAIIRQVGGYEERFTAMCEDQVVHAKVCLSHPVYASSKSWYRYRQHPNSCNARVWRAGTFESETMEFLRWLRGYLIQQGVANGETWEALQTRYRSLRPSLPKRASKVLRHQARRGWRFWKKTARKIRGTISPPPVILCYHRIFEPAADPHELSVSRDHFRQQLQVIQRLAEPMTLGRLVNDLPARRLPRSAVVLTFDDGYLDNLENALPLLQESGIPATIYVTAGALGTAGEFWWDDLERLVLAAPDLPERLRLQINGHLREWKLDAPNDVKIRERLYFDLHAELRPLSATQQRDVLARLRSLTGLPLEARSSYRCLNQAELKRLAADPLVSIGAHTLTHCDLDYRTREEQEAEIAGSKQALEAIIGRPVEHFSYPYGSFNSDSVAVCAANHFRSAVAVFEASIRPHAPLYGLPRLLVRNWDGPTFERKLKQLFRG